MRLLPTYPVESMVGIVGDAICLPDVGLACKIGLHKIGDIKSMIVAHSKWGCLNLFDWTPSAVQWLIN